ncbi:MAG: sulfotransferase, partial [Dongiaceae bacterium]
MTAPITPNSVSGHHFDAPVLITGLPRSGTSMVTGVLKECGLWLGKTVPGGKENARGYFENIMLREKAQKAILSAAGFDPLGVRKLPPPGWRLRVPDFKSGVAELLLLQKYDGKRSWGFKDPKTTLTWHIWHEHFPKATWVVVRRPAADVIASCLRTGFMNQHSADPAYWQVFVHAYELHLVELC